MGQSSASSHFGTAFEVQNLGSVHVDPLMRATSPHTAREAADDGRLNMISDSDCQDIIKSVAMEVYQIEKIVTIWHKNLCGPRAANNLLYKFICSVHEGSDESTKSSTQDESSPVSEPSKSRSPCKPGQGRNLSVSAPACQFSNQLVKPCELPDFTMHRLVSLAYFDCLFYVTVAKIRELHKELRDRLGHGLIALDTRICQDEHPEHTHYNLSTVDQVIQQLSNMWFMVMDPEVVASLDTALRFRKLGHWSIILGCSISAVDMKDCRDRRNDILKNKPAPRRKNAKFLKTEGLMDVSEHVMSVPMICILVNDLHAKAIREKEVLHNFITQTFEAARREGLATSEAVCNTQAVLEQRDGLDEKHSQTCVSSFQSQSVASLTVPHDVQCPSRMPKTCRAGAVKPDEAVNTETTLSTTIHQRGPRQLYALELYTTNREVPHTQAYSVPTNHSSEVKQRLSSCYFSAQSQTGPPSTSPRHSTRLDTTLTDRPGSHHLAARPTWQTLGGNWYPPRQTKAQILGYYQSQKLVALKSNATRMEPPPVDDTWSFPKDELYALLPEQPAYTSPVRSGKGTRRSSISFLKTWF